MATKAPRSLKARALQWLAQREQSRVELKRRLMPFAIAEVKAEAHGQRLGDVGAGVSGGGSVRGIARVEGDADLAAAAGVDLDVAVDPSLVSESAQNRVDALLDWLELHGYLSQERFAESRVHARLSRYGNLRIRQELKQHHVTLGAEAALALKENELQRACAVLTRKFPSPPADVAERAKQARFLSGRGFSPEVIARALRREDAGHHATFDG